MSTATDCRKYARECVELAQTAQCGQHRRMLLEMAEKWLRFADAEPNVELKPVLRQSSAPDVEELAP